MVEPADVAGGGHEIPFGFVLGLTPPIVRSVKTLPGRSGLASAFMLVSTYPDQHALTWTCAAFMPHTLVRAAPVMFGQPSAGSSHRKGTPPLVSIGSSRETVG